MNFGIVLSLILMLLAAIGALIEIPLVGSRAFWLVIAAYVIRAGSTWRWHH